MKNKLLNILLIFCIVFCTYACTKSKSIILFNKDPITKETLLNNSTEFRADKRFYYVFMTEKPLESNFIRVRIMKRDDKAYSMMTKLVYSNDFKLTKGQIFYYTDYLVMQEAGTYCMLIYTKADMRKPLAIADFKIRD